MDRAEATGLGVATAGHLALLAALTLGFANAVTVPPMNAPMEVSFVEDVGLQSASPDPAVEPAGATIASELGPPEEAAPPVVETPVPPEPRPQPEADVTPAPKETPKPSQKAAPAKAAPAKAQPKQSKADSKGDAAKSSGSRLGKDFLKNIGADAKSTSTKASGAVLSAQSLASIQSAIQRQIQPCANRQVNPGPGANEIRVTLNIRLNRDGSLARRPTVVRTSGVDSSNQRYEERVKDLAIASYVGCAPLRDLPPDLYSTAKGGWSNLNMNYNLP